MDMSVRPEEPRPREAIQHARAWVGREVTMMQARAATALSSPSGRSCSRPRHVAPMGYQLADGVAHRVKLEYGFWAALAVLLLLTASNLAELLRQSPPAPTSGCQCGHKGERPL